MSDDSPWTEAAPPSGPLADLRAIVARLSAMPPVPIALWVVDSQVAEAHIARGIRNVSGRSLAEHNEQLNAIRVMSWRSSEREDDRAWLRAKGMAVLLDAAPGLYLQMNKGPAVMILGEHTAERCYLIGQLLGRGASLSLP